MLRNHKKLIIFLIILLSVGVIAMSIYSFNYFFRQRPREELKKWFEENRQDLELIANNINDNLLPQEYADLVKYKNKDLEITLGNSIADRRSKNEEEKYKENIAPSMEKIKKIDNMQVKGFIVLNDIGRKTDMHFYEFENFNCKHYALQYHPEGIRSNFKAGFGLMLTQDPYPIVEIINDHWQMIELSTRYFP